MATTAEPVSKPGLPGPALAPPPAPAPPRKRWTWLLIALTVVAAAAAGVWQWLRSRPAEPATAAAAIRTVAADRGDVERTLRLAGQTGARQFVNITAPRPRGGPGGNTMVLQYLAAGGRIVKAGDRIADIDAQPMRDRLDDMRDQLKQAENDLGVTRSNQALDDENQRQAGLVAKASYDKALLDQKTGETLTDIDRQLFALSVEQAKARVDQLERETRFRKAGQRAELRNLELALQRQKLFVDRIEQNLDRFVMKTPMAGLVVVQSTFRGGEFGQIQAGDQLGSGQVIAKVVDPLSMQVEGVANQAETESLRVGQEARIGLDAFPGLRLKGKVYSIGALAAAGFMQSYYIRSIPVRISFEGLDPRVLPDMSAFADVVLERAADVVRVPVEAVRHENGADYVLVKGPQGMERRPVKTGVRSETHVAILEGLRVGEQVQTN